jgi:hypothetical protein
MIAEENTGNGHPSRRHASWGPARQYLSVFAAWLFLWVPRAGNDGLWYQGDSPRHAATGLFYKHVITEWPANPLAYAKAFAHRYPIISPQSYPPVFYVVEAVAFTLLGPSPYVGKTLVLLFALMAALYTLAWLSRWVSTEVGELAALLLLVPGVFLWSNVIMLNVPSLALLLASLYHTRRWLEGTDRQIYPAAALGLLAILAYPQSGVLVFVAGAWMLATRRWKLLWNVRLIAITLLCALAILPWAIIIATYSPSLAMWAVPPPTTFEMHHRYIYYVLHAPEFFGVFLLTLSAVGSVAGLTSRDTRGETGILLIWLVVTYLVFSLMRGKDPRYAISLAVPIVLLAAMAVLQASRVIARLLRRRIESPAASVLCLAVLAAQACVAWSVPVPETRGYREIAHYFEQVAPRDAVVFDGFHVGVFGYYALINDPLFERRLINSVQLFYEAGLSDSSHRPHERISPAMVVDLLEKVDCRWIAIEIGLRSPRFEVGHVLRDALTGDRFEMIRSFPVSGEGALRVDIYQMTPRPEQSSPALSQTSDQSPPKDANGLERGDSAPAGGPNR